MAKKLLLVDDNPEVRNLLRLTFSFGDYKIREACNGVDALSAVIEWRPDIVLLDIMMPGEKSGLDVCREVKQNPDVKNTFIIMLTACGQEQDILRGTDAGADVYLVKPFSPQTLNALVAHHISTNESMRSTIV